MHASLLPTNPNSTPFSSSSKAQIAQEEASRDRGPKLPQHPLPIPIPKIHFSKCALRPQAA